jgi:hypothetical protein
MSRGISISTIILSAILISSCATDRIQIAQKKDLACKTPKTRYDYGKNKPILAIKSNNSKYIRYAYHAIWNNTHNGYSSKNITRKDKHPEKFIYSLGETQNYHILTNSGTNELLFLQQILKSSEINLYHYELRKLPDPVRLINEPKDLIISPLQEDILFPINKVNDESGYSYVVLKQEDIDGIIPDESSDEARVSILNTVKSDQSQKTPFQRNEIFILMMAILGGLIPLAAIKASPKLASNISFWAAMNPWKTRFMFAGIQIAMGTAGVLLGERLADNGIHFSDLSRDLLVGAFLTSSMLYPVKYSSINFFKHSYLRQKAFDLALALSGFLLMVNAGNDPGMRASLTNMVSFKGHEQQNLNMLNYNSQKPKQLLYYPNDKQLQNEQTAPQKKETSRGLKSFYTVLALLAALALGFLVAAAACGLSCNGMVGLAFLVGIGGGGLVIAFAVWLIKSIWHPKHKKRIKPSEGTDSIPKEGALQT